MLICLVFGIFVLGVIMVFDAIIPQDSQCGRDEYRPLTEVEKDALLHRLRYKE